MLLMRAPIRHLPVLLCAALAACTRPASASGLPHPIALDAHGRVYVIDSYRHVLWRVDPDGHRMLLATNVDAEAVAVAPNGTVYLPSDAFDATFRWQLRVIAPNGASHDTVITTGVSVSHGSFLTIDSAASLYFYRGAEVGRVTLDGQLSSLLIRLPAMRLGSIAWRPNGTLVVLDGNAVRSSREAELSEVLAGDTTEAGFVDSVGRMARFDQPLALAVDGNDNIYVADYGNRSVRKVTPERRTSTLAHPAWPWRPSGLAISGDTLYVLERATGFGDAATIPHWLANALGTPRVERILPDGRVEVLTSMANGTTRSAMVIGVLLLGAMAAPLWRRLRRATSV